ncbi:NUDIX domain-containing protein [Phytohabitans sp. LJ34]|uniref:NUDIX domain-containing protein n=1 Tax=Phytohabitans sp. LJ34 TaxID=3452217 RepID=UPI003F88CAC6
MADITYTHPDVLTIGVRDGWADPETDPTRIDWPTRQATAAIPFHVVDGRPVNPCEKTAVRYGRNRLGHWGEHLAADALVFANDTDGHRWIVMVERADGNGWALPGGKVDPGENPTTAAIRELAEEAGLSIPDATWHTTPPRYVPDPRASDESWMVTVLSRTHLGNAPRDGFPAVIGADDAARAAWVRADTYRTLTDYIHTTYQGRVFAAHQRMLATALDDITFVQGGQ